VTAKLKEKVAVCIRMLERRALLDMNGHASIRDGDSVLINDSNVSTHGITGEGILTVALDATVAPANAPIELPIHVCIYERYEDINAVIHFHPLYATLCSLMRTGVPTCSIFGAHLGEVSRLEYPGRIDNNGLGEDLAEKMTGTRACLLRGHGAVVVGKTLEEAYAAALYLEENSEKWILSAGVADVEPLTNGEVEKVKQNAWDARIMRRIWNYELSKLCASDVC